MCMPERDQAIQTVREHLNCAMRWVKQRTQQINPNQDACNKCWTLAMKAALCHASMAIWGGCNSLRICATNPTLTKPGKATVCNQPPGHICAGVPGPYPWQATNPEWLYDVTCLRYQGAWPSQQQTLLVAEMEWGGPANSLEDFAKLLVARAELRVFLGHAVGKAGATFAQFANYISQCHDTNPDDTYLLVFFDFQLKYCRIDGLGAHAQLAPIPSDYYPLNPIHRKDSDE